MCADLLAQPGLGPHVERVQADPQPGPGGDQDRVVEACGRTSDPRTASWSARWRGSPRGQPRSRRVRRPRSRRRPRRRPSGPSCAGRPARTSPPRPPPPPGRCPAPARRSDAADACPDDRSRPSAPVVVTIVTPCRRAAATTASAPDWRALAPVIDALATPRPAMASMASTADSSGEAQPADRDSRMHAVFAPFAWGERQPLTMRMASWTSRGSSGCIRAIDSFTGRPSFMRPLEQQAGDAGLLVPGERVEPAEFGHRPAERVLVGADDLAARRGARDRARARRRGARRRR